MSDAKRRVRSQVGSGFLTSERGTILPFNVITVVLLVMFGAIAVNAVRIESIRSSSQATLDICILNAAALRQTLDERQVFMDCVAKNNFRGRISNLTVTEEYSSKSVTATAEVETDFWFLRKFAGGTTVQPDKFVVRTTSGAAEHVGNVEVALVLDVSGSMRNNNRLVKLKEAARRFVSTLLTDDNEGRIAITLIPYNGQVNLGPRLASKYRIQGAPTGVRRVYNQIWVDVNLDNSRCVDLPATLYAVGSSAIARNLNLPATPFADPFSGTFTENLTTFVSADADLGRMDPVWVWCPPTVGNFVMLPDQTPAGQQALVETPALRIKRLHAAIDALTAEGNTSINAGMRWGLALLDPAARGIYSEFTQSGEMPRRLEGLPRDFGDPDTMKIIVLMSDGKHFSEHRMRSPFTSSDAALSPVFRASDNRFSIFHNRPDTNDYWVPHLSAWRATPYAPAGQTATRIAWSEVFQRVRATWVAWQLYARPFNDAARATTQMNLFRTLTTVETMDSQLQNVCKTARANNVVVYTIAFDAPVEGQTQLRACANTVARYYVASTLSISQVFASIATNISKLRLTQ